MEKCKTLKDFFEHYMGEVLADKFNKKAIIDMPCKKHKPSMDTCIEVVDRRNEEEIIADMLKKQEKELDLRKMLLCKFSGEEYEYEKLKYDMLVSIFKMEVFLRGIYGLRELNLNCSYLPILIMNKDINVFATDLAIKLMKHKMYIEVVDNFKQFSPILHEVMMYDYCHMKHDVESEHNREIIMKTVIKICDRIALGHLEVIEMPFESPCLQEKEDDCTCHKHKPCHHHHHNAISKCFFEEDEKENGHK